MKKFKYIVLQDLNASKRLTKSRDRSFGPSISNEGVSSVIEPPELSISTNDMTMAQAADEERNPDTLTVARDMPIELISPIATTASDEFEPTEDAGTWGVKAVGADSSARTGSGITVAVLDTGIKADHAAFSDPALNITAKNFTNDSDDDTNGHGTHCAGTIFGRDVSHNGDSLQIGVARGVNKALIGKVIGSGAGTAELIEAISWARSEGAHVISMSLGYDHAGLIERLNVDFPPAKAASELLAIYLENMRQFDMLMNQLSLPVSNQTNPLIIAASGNESEADSLVSPYRISAASPSAALHVVAVGALGQVSGGKLDVAPFSNTSVDLVAPGVGVMSAGLDGGLASLSGTSMATPHVAGLAALYYEQIVALGLPQTAVNVRGLLVGSAKREALVAGVSAGDVGMGLPIAPS